MTPAETHRCLPSTPRDRARLVAARLDALHEARACAHAAATVAEVRHQIDRLIGDAEAEIHALQTIQRAHDTEAEQASGLRM